MNNLVLKILLWKIKKKICHFNNWGSGADGEAHQTVNLALIDEEVRILSSPPEKELCAVAQFIYHWGQPHGF